MRTTTYGGLVPADLYSGSLEVIEGVAGCGSIDGPVVERINIQVRFFEYEINVPNHSSTAMGRCLAEEPDS